MLTMDDELLTKLHEFDVVGLLLNRDQVVVEMNVGIPWFIHLHLAKGMPLESYVLKECLSFVGKAKELDFRVLRKRTSSVKVF